MILHPGVLALLLGSSLTSAMVGYAAWLGVRIIRHWDIRSGSEEQLELERRTYLVSMLMSYALGFQIVSLFLFIYTADTLSPMFIGAMCAAGSLKVNGFGYPALVVKIVTCLMAGLWLVVNATDNKAHDYPLIRVKYWLLLFLVPLVLTETVLQGAYLLGLQPNIITSCCALVFSAESGTVLSDLLSLQPAWSQAAVLASTIITLVLGLSVLLKTKGAALFSLAALLHFLLAIVALISFISLYIYELPTHHCPFCLLHPEYHAIGYPLYAAMLVSAVCGMGTGIIQPFRTVATLRQVIPAMQRKLALASLIATLAFVVITGYSMLFSNLKIAS
jgi:hypothetical protein